MVQVDIKTTESQEKKIEEDPQEELNKKSTERDTESDTEELEIPLDKMTKGQLFNKVKEVQEIADKNFDLYVRSQAEIDNLKKRFQKEKTELYKFSNESLIKKLLSVGDNLEKAISHSNDDNSLDALREGVELTLKGLMDTLEKEGLESVKALGEPFDPNFHEAVSELQDNSAKPGTVIQELQKGYTLNERLIRPAMVIVSKNDE